MIDPNSRKLEFFIGATKRDLGRVREKLIEAVLEAGHIPSGMELWASGINPVQYDIARHLERCDVHIIVLGSRYGDLLANSKISFTEWEYRQSVNKRPILAFIVNDKEFEEGLKESNEEQIKKKKLREFRKTLLGKSFCRSFSNTDRGIADLGRLCVNAIHELINSEDLQEDAGWIKASSSEALTLRDIRANPFLERQLLQLREFNVVSKRMILDKVTKQTQAEVFWKYMQGSIRRNNYRNLFFESGSSLAYVADRFESDVWYSKGSDENWRVWTNNVLILFQLLLNTDIDVRRFPPSSPDPKDRYAAIFPREWKRLYEPPPLRPRKLYQTERNAVHKMIVEMQAFGEYNTAPSPQNNLQGKRKSYEPNDKSKALLLTTTSCWDLEHEMKHFRGPHVGSHPNMLFKRALLSTGMPAVMFLTAEKLGDPFIEGTCYPVFGPDLPLEEALKKYPLALCVGYDMKMRSPTKEGISLKIRKDRNNPERIKKTLEELNFKNFYNKFHGEIGAIIAGNQAFYRQLPFDEPN